ncbi:amino acid ABC transporter membrane protein 1 (PAAT family) [Stackebrandtia endophytica]|uniref:Amino acid ABC transporter membrane protein 1 (PAAT family) n=1 Tax=Stackebrandtia endophytica TaxID=1496996 RepID=A0A543ASY5_9ACTN|nr:ectoine/hydroxyectoine ABC transporter permease subunit EhuC [Stackebrandtia endophytica]TQL75702.1 amino acid ABC transporter membrane protein 1 (PAAT family) [Stackebrandtia endophytica]
MDFINNVAEALPSYLVPLSVTVSATLFGAMFALIVAFSLGLMAGSKITVVRGVARTIIEFFRGTSLVVQLFWFVVVLPQVFEVRFDAVLVVAILALGMNYGAYAAEVVRGSIAGVATGQWEACVALNLSYWQKMRLVIIPQAWPEMIPPLSTLAILLLKGSSLVSLVGLADLTFHAQVLGRRPDQEMLFHLGMILVIYFVLSYLIAAGMRFLERRAKRGIGQEPVATRRPRAKDAVAVG